MQQIRQSLESVRIGFVPTMGSLHKGHLSLLDRAKATNPVTIMSIFVNDKQFAPHEDFNEYPRVLNKDLELLKGLSPNFIFAPHSNDMYPQGFGTAIEVEGVGRGVLDGIARPHFFGGVCTVVTKLFNIVRPTQAFFGQKDAQQCVVIKKLVEDLNINTEVVICPTVREANGLAMSSRNEYLTPDERSRAGLLYRSLLHAEKMYKKDKSIDARQIEKEMIAMIKQERDWALDYVKIVHPKTLAAIEGPIGDEGCLIALACKVGKARLIDNILLTSSQ